MPTDLDVKTLVERGGSFVYAESIDYAAPTRKVVMSCLEWNREGIPFVIQGVPLDVGSETPFDGSTEWLKKLLSTRGRSRPSDLDEIES
jgi:hypothetical protein